MDYRDSALSFRDQIASNNFVSEGNPNATPIADILRMNQKALEKTARNSRASSRKRSPARAATGAAREHAAIVRALHDFENALACPALGREQEWMERVRGELVPVIETFQRHRESAEGNGGIIAEAEASVGRPEAINALIVQHNTLTRKARQLLFTIQAPQSEVREIRRRGWLLANALQGHRALEADLIMEAFYFDIGGRG